MIFIDYVCVRTVSLSVLDELYVYMNILTRNVRYGNEYVKRTDRIEEKI